MNSDTRSLTTNIQTHIIPVAPFVMRVSRGVRKNDVFIFRKTRIYSVIIAEAV